MPVLDQAYSLARIASLDPASFAAEVAAELPADHVARDAALVAALDQIDVFSTRVMRLRLDHALAADTSIAAPTRNVFASTIVNYARNLALLEERAADIARRGGAARPEQVALLVGDAARETLALRAALRAGVLALIREVATAALAEADRNARDRTRDDAQRKHWSAVRRDLEALAADPEHVRTGVLRERLARLPEQLDEPEPGPEVTFADMIELD